MAKSGLREKYKGAFFSGLAALLPTILTIFVITFCWTFLSEKVTEPINNGIGWILKLDFAKEWYWTKLLHKQPWQLNDELDDAEAQEAGVDDKVMFSEMVADHVPWWIGFVIALVLVLFVGFLFKGYIGRQIWRSLERGLQKVPVLKVIYPYAKQVTEFFFSEKKQMQYEAAVAVEYPRKGIYSLGFVTSEGFRDLEAIAGQETVAIFIPSSPTPVTGYTIIVPREQVVKLDVTPDEALRFTMSAGVIVPPRQLPEVTLKTRKLEKPQTLEREPETTRE